MGDRLKIKSLWVFQLSAESVCSLTQFKVTGLLQTFHDFQTAPYSEYQLSYEYNVTWVAWSSGLRRWFKAPVSSEAWVRIPPLPPFVVFKPNCKTKLDQLFFEPINLANTLLSSNILKQMSVHCICFSPSRFSPFIITQLSQISQYE